MKACLGGNTFSCGSVESQTNKEDHRAGGLFFESSGVSIGGLCHVLIFITMNFVI